MIVTLVFAETLAVVMVKCADRSPAGTVTEAGTRATALPLLSEMGMPPPRYTSVSVTVLFVVEAPPTT